MDFKLPWSFTVVGDSELGKNMQHGWLFIHISFIQNAWHIAARSSSKPVLFCIKPSLDSWPDCTVTYIQAPMSEVQTVQHVQQRHPIFSHIENIDSIHKDVEMIITCPCYLHVCQDLLHYITWVIICCTPKDGGGMVMYIKLICWSRMLRPLRIAIHVYKTC
jgi:hypothetical protein